MIDATVMFYKLQPDYTPECWGGEEASLRLEVAYIRSLDALPKVALNKIKSDNSGHGVVDAQKQHNICLRNVTVLSRLNSINRWS